MKPRVVYNTRVILPAAKKDCLSTTQKNCVVYELSCRCDARYVGRTTQRLADRIEQHSILKRPILKRSILERDKLKVQAENSPEIWSAYKRKRNQVTKRIRISIRDYYNGLIEENIRDQKKMWRTINTVLTRERDVVEAMNRHFALVGLKLAEITSKPDDDCLCYITPK